MKRIDRVNQNLGGTQCPQVQGKILLKKLNNDVNCVFPPDRANEHAIMVPKTTSNLQSTPIHFEARGTSKTAEKHLANSQRKISLYTSKINEFTN